MNRTDLRRLAAIRLDEAGGLLAARKYDGAYYLAGYAVECALKACLARRTRRHDFPPLPKVVGSYYTHDIKELLKAAELLDQLSLDVKSNPALGKNWGCVYPWKEDRRYRRNSRTEAEEIIDAISSEPDGVLAWIRRFW